MQVQEISLEDMWQVIEIFGIRRELLDPHNELSYKTVHALYLTIKNNPIMGTVALTGDQ